MSDEGKDWQPTWFGWRLNAMLAAFVLAAVAGLVAGFEIAIRTGQ